jgi:hypothetical protein
MERMKDFVIKEFDRFLEIADTISTPFKFVEATESDVGEEYQFVEARVWMRTAYISWKTDVKKEQVKEIITNLKRHSFSEAKIEETAFPIK